MAETFLLVATIGLLCSISAWLPARRLGPFSMVYMLSGWLTGELALQHLAWQAAATLGFALAGALESPLGLAGLAITFVSWALLLASHLRGVRAGSEARAALAPLGLAVDADVSPVHGLRTPFRMRQAGVEKVRDLAYGAILPGDKGRRNLLDVVRPVARGERRPALLQIHGGAWIIGDKREQGQPLMTHLASRGWVCFAINYRLSPQATFPDHIVDVKRAIRWIREHAAEHGADPDFLCVTGGSAGGHLAALAAVSANDPRFQPGFEAVDTRLAAAVPFYGVYDFLDRFGIRGSQKMEPFLAQRVLKCTPDENRELWESASPITHVSGDAPPFLLVHGTHDSLTWLDEMRAFERALSEKSRQPVLKLELEGAQHAFDTFHSPRSAHAVRAVTAFLEHVHEAYRESGRGGRSAQNA
jgi:acetyl esterase/lipase